MQRKANLSASVVGGSEVVELKDGTLDKKLSDLRKF